MDATIKRLEELTKALGGRSAELETIADQVGAFDWKRRALLAACEAVSGAIGIIDEVREGMALEQIQKD